MNFKIFYSLLLAKRRANELATIKQVFMNLLFLLPAIKVTVPFLRFKFNWLMMHLVTLYNAENRPKTIPNFGTEENDRLQSINTTSYLYRILIVFLSAMILKKNLMAQPMIKFLPNPFIISYRQLP